jgi:hypothetical protein
MHVYGMQKSTEKLSPFFMKAFQCNNTWLLKPLSNAAVASTQLEVRLDGNGSILSSVLEF